ncbi:MAG: hypothetical protein WBA17_14260 [Saprospiraceae bacterium]
MNKLMMIFGLLLLTVAGLQAQRPADRGAREDQTDRKTTVDLIRANRVELQITDRQMAQLEELSAETRTAAQELRSGDQPREDKRTAGRELMQQQRAKMDAILTSGQQEKLKEIRRAEQPRRTAAARGKTVAKHRGKGMAFIRANQTELGVTSDQMARLEALTAETQAAAIQIRDGNQLKEEKKAAARELMDEQKQQMNAILTPEQQSKMKAMLREKKQNRNGSNERK